MKRTAQQNRILHSLLSELSISNENKENMVFSYTGGRTEHSSEMTQAECQAMINELERMAGKAKERQNKLKQTLRRNIFKLMYDLGYLNATMSSAEKLAVINRWTYKMLHIDKHLNYLSIDELRKVINQLQAVRRNYDKQTKKQVACN